MVYRTTEDWDYRLKCEREDDADFIDRLPEARILLMGLGDLSFGGKCARLARSGKFGWQEASAFVHAINKESQP